MKTESIAKVIIMMMAVVMLVGCVEEFPEEELPDEEIPVEEPTIDKSSFTYEVCEHRFATMQYRKCVIAQQEDVAPALVLYLHGGTSKGDDNEKPLAEAAVDSIGNYLLRNEISSVFIVPQCPADKMWNGVMKEVLRACIDECVASESIDTNHIYIFGGSMGGTGTWNMLSTYPGFFAAAMPVAGNPTGCIAHNVAKTPVYTVMGTADVIMDIDVVSNYINLLATLGGETMFDIEEGWSHANTCEESYTAGRLEWVFSH